MNNFFKENKKRWFLILLFLAVIFLVSFFDRGLVAGLIVASLLTILLFYFLLKSGLGDKKVYWLFFIVFSIHFLAVLFIYYTGFSPANSGADFDLYNQNAIEISQRFRQGNFSLQGVYINHYFPLLIGIIYTLTVPEMIVGQMFSAWLAALSVVILYFLILEIGGSKKSAFFTGLLVVIYPSYLYFGSLLLKDTVIIPLILLGLLLAVKMIKNFSGLKFLLFFIVLTTLIHFRFYVGFALLFSFIIGWFFISKTNPKDRIIYGLTIIFLLGFSPQLVGYGYYGLKPISYYLKADVITKYREVVYAPSPDLAILKGKYEKCRFIDKEKCLEEIALIEQQALPESSSQTTHNKKSLCQDCLQQITETGGAGVGSSFIVKTGFDNPLNFSKSYLKSLTYSLLGPFPWQLRYKRHWFFLADTIPWYLILAAAFYGIFKIIQKEGFRSLFLRYKFSLPLLCFSLIALGVLSLFINNFGIIARIRIPIYIVLLGVMSLSFEYLPWVNKLTSFTQHIFERLNKFIV